MDLGGIDFLENSRTYIDSNVPNLHCIVIDLIKLQYSIFYFSAVCELIVLEQRSWLWNREGYLKTQWYLCMSDLHLNFTHKYVYIINKVKHVQSINVLILPCSQLWRIVLQEQEVTIQKTPPLGGFDYVLEACGWVPAPVCAEPAGTEVCHWWMSILDLVEAPAPPVTLHSVAAALKHVCFALRCWPCASSHGVRASPRWVLWAVGNEPAPLLWGLCPADCTWPLATLAAAKQHEALSYIIFHISYTRFFKVTSFGPISDEDLSDLDWGIKRSLVQIYYVVVSDIFNSHPKIGEDVLPFWPAYFSDVYQKTRSITCPKLPGNSILKGILK